MSSSSETKSSWLDQWWPLLVILFGAILFAFFALWHPVV